MRARGTVVTTMHACGCGSGWLARVPLKRPSAHAATPPFWVQKQQPVALMDLSLGLPGCWWLVRVPASWDRRRVFSSESRVRCSLSDLIAFLPVIREPSFARTHF